MLFLYLSAVFTLLFVFGNILEQFAFIKKSLVNKTRIQKFTDLSMLGSVLSMFAFMLQVLI